MESQYVRDSYSREMIESLRQSPAWTLFVKVLLKYMNFVQDDITFRMNAFTEQQVIVKEWAIDGYVEETDYFAVGQVIHLKVDTRPTEIWCNYGEISIDGVNYRKYQVVDGEFYVRVTTQVAKSQLYLIPRNFYPNRPVYKDIRDVMDIYGVYHEEDKDSDFFNYKTATSAYLIDYFLKRSNIEYSLDYFYLETDDSIESKGVKEMLVRSGISLVAVGNNRYVYKSTLTLRPGKDFIVSGSNNIEIISADTDTVILSSTVLDGVYSVFRSDYLVGLSPDRKLISAIEIEYDKKDIEFMKRFLPRVIPVRCQEGFKGFVSVRVKTTNKLIEQCYPNPVYHVDTTTVLDNISWFENQVLYADSTMLAESLNKIYDTVLSEAEFTEITLI